MADVHVPPNMAAKVRALAQQAKRDPQAVFEEVLAAGIAAAQKRAFDQDLTENYAAIERGEYVTEEQSLAEILAAEHGE